VSGCKGLHCDGCGRGGGGLAALVVVLAVVLASSAAVAQAISDLLIALAIGAGVLTAGGVAALVVVLRATRGVTGSPRHLEAPRTRVLPPVRPAAARPARVSGRPRQAIPPPRLLIEPPRPGRILRGLVVPPARHEAPERRNGGA
jgi:hypothetical protein